MSTLYLNQRSQPLWTPFLGKKIDIQNSFKRGVVSFESGTVSFKNYAARILKVSWLKFVLDFHRKYYSWKLIQLGLYFGYFGIGIKFWYILIDNIATFKARLKIWIPSFHVTHRNAHHWVPWTFEIHSNIVPLRGQ